MACEFVRTRAMKQMSSLSTEPRMAERGAAVPASSDKMATPSELSLEEIRKYLLENGGTARNHDVVKHFKKFLTDPETRGRSKSLGTT